MNVRRLVVAIVAAPMLMAIVAMACVSPARAAGSPDISGTWRCCGAGGAAHQKWVITDSSDRLSGHGGGGAITYPIRGRIADSNARLVTGPYKQLPSYTATFLGTVSASNTEIKGTWSSNAHQHGTFTAIRISGAPAAAAASPSSIMSSLPTTLEAIGSTGTVTASALVAAAAVLFLAFTALSSTSPARRTMSSVPHSARRFDGCRVSLFCFWQCRALS